MEIGSFSFDCLDNETEMLEFCNLNVLMDSAQKVSCEVKFHSNILPESRSIELQLPLKVFAAVKLYKWNSEVIMCRVDVDSIDWKAGKHKINQRWRVVEEDVDRVNAVKSRWWGTRRAAAEKQRMAIEWLNG